MNQRHTGYWVATVLFSLVYFGSGLADVLHASPVIQTLAHLGYPPYFASIIGPWKIAAAITILAPGLPKVKEWAYAGVVFDLTGALASHAVLGDHGPKQIVPIVLLGLLVVSYRSRFASRVVGDVGLQTAPAR
ncbi:MAG TPA: DoxX family protein [Polyangiaceae bacterium]|jgi:hypothetical protein|nr:DoxX family protein [Polyangiaceae bacterium]